MAVEARWDRDGKRANEATDRPPRGGKRANEAIEPGSGPWKARERSHRPEGDRKKRANEAILHLSFTVGVIEGPSGKSPIAPAGGMVEVGAIPDH
jgi:hypothetical protein